ncbi:MAG TPA: NAD(+)/NADH kinase [Abditibacteriaceae bacterium]|nr:NAD(+)/NADH kinase [Abditibacteriaceae bacterium]
MNSLGIFAAPGKANARALALKIISLSEAAGIAVKIQSQLAPEIDRDDLGVARDEDIAASDVLVTLGGDGAVLVAARAAAPYKTPVLAIDLGRLGFLSAVRPTELEEAFARLLGGELVAEERMMLEARVLRARQEERGAPNSLTEVGGGIGLNDAVVAKSALARILRLSIFLDGDLAAETRSDGLIIATPTGSTAYALSAGGPIVHPGVPLLLVCPICAHSLAQRPLVVGADETVELHAEWEGDEVASSELEAMLTIDGQIGVRLQPGDRVQVRQAQCTARLLHLPGYNFYDRLREKMGWG